MQEAYGNKDVALAIIDAREEMENVMEQGMSDRAISATNINEYGFENQKCSHIIGKRR